MYRGIFNLSSPHQGRIQDLIRGGAPDRDRPKTAILGPQFCRIWVLGPHFWWSGGGPGPPGPPGPPWFHPCLTKGKVWMYEEIMMNDDNLESNLLGESILTSIGAKHQSPGIIHLLNALYHLCVSQAIFYNHLGSLTVI